MSRPDAIQECKTKGAILSEARKQFQEIRDLIQHSATGIGLQTYGRKPGEMVETSQWLKLQMAENLIRKTRDLVFPKIDHAISEINKALKPEENGRGPS